MSALLHFPSRRARLMLLAAVAVVGALVLWLVVRTFDVRHAGEVLLAWVRGAGPWAFFTAMAVLPAFGCPLSLFTLTVAPVFSHRLGLAGVLVFSALALAANLALSYALARYVFRPWLARLFKWLGYKLPEVPPEDQTSLIVLLRVTPGPPFFLQSYLLGFAQIPFRKYLLISWLAAFPGTVAFILLGESVAQGRGRLGLLALSLLVAFAVLVQFLRRRYARRARIATEGETAPAPAET